MRLRRLWEFLGTVAMAVFLVVAVVRDYIRAHPPAVHDYRLPHDDFDATTMAMIRADLDQYNVAGSPFDHEVYMVTGGLSIANPRVMGWDSDGNMNFGGNDPGDPMYSLQETSRSPAVWSMQRPQKGGIAWTNGSAPGYTPVPWVRKRAKSGATYYEWDMIRNQMAQFYFKEGDTYIVVRMDYVLETQPPFPQGLMTHLVAVGNPVTHRGRRGTMQ